MTHMCTWNSFQTIHHLVDTWRYLWCK